MALYLPGAKWRPISYRAAAGKFTHPPLGYVVHVPVSTGSLFGYFDGLKSPGRKFCTAWVAKDGSSEQYTTLDMKAWAQGDGNGDYWSFEVEGFPGEPMTDAQLDTLARWHKFLGVKDAIATAPGQQGIGTHQMGGNAWGGHSCPGAIRTAQLPQIIARASTTPTKDWFDMATQADLKAVLLDPDVARNIAKFVASGFAWKGPDGKDRVLAGHLAALDGLSRVAIKAATEDLTTAQVQQAVADALAANYDVTLTATPKGA